MNVLNYSSDAYTAWWHCIHNKSELQESSVCGCFFCKTIFSPKEIIEWADSGSTSLCPYCGIDSVIGENSGYPITVEFLQQMHDCWFSQTF